MIIYDTSNAFSSTDAQLTQDLEMALKVLPDFPTADDENEFTEIEDYVPADI